MASAKSQILKALVKLAGRRARRRALPRMGRMVAASAGSAVLAVGVISAVRSRRRRKAAARLILPVRRMADAVRRSVPIQISIGDGARPPMRKTRPKRAMSLAMTMARTAGMLAGTAAAARVFTRMSRRDV
jgi:hypothetical protein